MSVSSDAVGDAEIRLARRNEIPLLADIERAASGLLIAAGALEADNGSTTPSSLLEQAWEKDLLYVAADQDDDPVGFLAAAKHDGALYIGEIDVLPDWQRRGIGRAMIETALEKARQLGLWGAMLTTDRFAPFNFRFYASVGFVEASGNACPPSLAAVLQGEIVDGLSAERRVGMVLRF